MRPRFAANDALWRGQAKHTGSDLSAATFFAEVAAQGFDGIELGNCHDTIGTPAETLALVRDHGLEIAAYASNITYNPWPPNVERWQRDLHYAAELGVRTVMTCGGFIPSPRRTTHAFDYDMFRSSLEPMLALAEDLGLVIAYHPHRGCVVETIAETRAILERVPQLKLTVDIAHLEAVGEDALAFIREFGDRIVHTHIKDYHWERDSFCNLGDGDGDLDVAACLHALQAQGYDGWWCFELDRKWRDEDADAPTEAGRALAFMREALAASTR